MDLTQFDLQGLQSLHISYKNVLKDHEDYLEKLTRDDNFYELNRSILIQKIELFKTQIELIEQKINSLNKERLRFSVEFMQWNYGNEHSCVQVHFLTTSEAYKVYGPICYRECFN